jgi:hypothetical protein
MNGYTKLAAGLAAVLVVGFVGWQLLPGPGGSGSQPTPGPTASAAPTAAVELPPAASATPAPSVAGASLPDAFSYRWIGEPRPIGTEPASTRTGLNFGPTIFYVTGDDYGTGADFLLANVSLTPDSKLRFETRAEKRTCAVGAVGTYPWTMSPGGTVLTIQPGTEACPERAAAVTGTWYRVNCKDVQGGCLGDLEAGTHRTQNIDPRVSPGEQWAPRLGAMTYSVPAGWSNSTDFATALALTPSADYATYTSDGPPDGNFNEISVWTHPTASDQAQACQHQTDASVPPTVDGLVGFLRKVPGLEVTEPVTVTIDGHPGKMMDLRLAASWTGRCEGETQPSLEFFAAIDTRVPVTYGLYLLGAERVRLILLDLGDGDVVAILFDSSDPSRFDKLVADGMPIVESFKFN